MNGFFKTIIAGWGAKKLGGGCFSTIIIFVLIYYALGQCNKPASRPVSQQQTPVSQQQTPVPVQRAE
jgi:hypothetical protein